MKKRSYLSEYSQHDPKLYRETLGSFGTTTKPGANQLTELQTKIRQGVKHVELHLASTGKGQFGTQDTPDKYGFEQRRTIMQLAKLNQQTLSVHANFEVNSFSGMGQGGTFDDSTRLNAMKEIDETLKFAAETAKSGAVVFHIQGEPLSTDRGELNLSKEYLDWLKKNRPEEFKSLEQRYFTSNPYEREFLSDPEKIYDLKDQFAKLYHTNKEEYDSYLSQEGSFEKAWVKYAQDKTEEKRKLSPDMTPLVVIGDKLGQTQRSQDIINFENLTKDNFSQKELESLKKTNIDLRHVDTSTIQRIMSFFSNGVPPELKSEVSQKEYNKLKSKLITTYEDILSKNNYLQSQADAEFHKKLLDTQIQLAKLQEQDLDINFSQHRDSYDKLQEVKRKEQEEFSQLLKATEENNTQKIQELKLKSKQLGLEESEHTEFMNLQQKLQNGANLSPQEQKRAQELQSKISIPPSLEKQQILQDVGGQLEFQKLEQYDEMKSQIREKVHEFEKQKKDIRSVTDLSFEKNASAMAHLGIKALQYQLDLKQKAQDSQGKLQEITSKIKKAQNSYDLAKSYEEEVEANYTLQKLKQQHDKLIGYKDYQDIDVKENPLYLAPENMLPGMGSMTSLEEYKAIMRMSQEEFAKRVLSEDKTYAQIKASYEQETGEKITTHTQALALAKRHLGGTFDNAHAGVWLKHFKREEGESEENRIDRFNKWLNSQAEDMYKEGLIKHIHLNDTNAKDDDHNLIGTGILDVQDLQQRLRKSGFKESFIVEAGGRGAHNNMHLDSAFQVFNPQIAQHYSQKATNTLDSGVSDWTTVSRDYIRRPQYSSYGMSPHSFSAQPRDNQERGSWSGTSFF